MGATDQSCLDYAVAELSKQNEILSLFRDVLSLSEEENPLGGTLFALDGCELS